MSRRVSLNARLAAEDHASDELEIVLLRITHPALPEPIRLSSDNTERLSVEPLYYGTRSAWLSPAGQPYLFMMMSAILPGDQDDAPPAATIIVDAITARIAETLRMTTARANVDMAVVLASDIHRPQAEWRGLKLISAEGSAAEISLTISMEPITSEPWPAARMTRARFPGLHK
jgi:hypothetical protein